MQSVAHTTVLIERYTDGFDPANGGGIEMASCHLGRALVAAGVDVQWYTPRDWRTLDEFGTLVERSGADMVMPLLDSPVFASAGRLLAPQLRQRIVRLWHDVSLLAPSTYPVPVCPQHGAPDGTSLACAAAMVGPTSYAADVFFFDDVWTHCFPRRCYIPWSVDHLPDLRYRSRSGPILLLVGKMRVEYAEAILDACERLGVAVRVVFSRWSGLGQQSRPMVLARSAAGGLECIEQYDLMRDHAMVFGGTSAALVLSQYRETFNFLAAEAVHFGIPVVAFADSGATLRFASAIATCAKDVIDLVGSGAHTRLIPVARSIRTWADVATAYVDLADKMRGGLDRRPEADAVYANPYHMSEDG